MTITVVLLVQSISNRTVLVQGEAQKLLEGMRFMDIRKQGAKECAEVCAETCICMHSDEK